MFNFNKFAQASVQEEYIRNMVRLPLSELQIQNLVANMISSNYSISIVNNLSIEIINFLSNHLFTADVVRILIRNNTKPGITEEVLNLYKQYIDGGGNPKILNYGTTASIVKTMQQSSLGFDFGNPYITTLFSKFINDKTTDEQKIILSNIAKIYDKQDVPKYVSYILKISPDDSYTIELLSKFLYLYQNYGRLHNITERLLAIDNKYFAKFMMQDFSIQQLFLDKLAEEDRNYLKIHKIAIEYIIHQDIYDPSKMDKIGMIFKNIYNSTHSDNVDPQYLDISPEYILDGESQRYNPFVIQLALKKITGRDDNTEIKNKLSKTQSFDSLCSHVDSLNSDYIEINEKIFRKLQPSVEKYFDLLATFSVEDFKKFYAANSFRQVSDSFKLFSPSSANNEFLENFHYYLNTTRQYSPTINNASSYKSLLAKLVKQIYRSIFIYKEEDSDKRKQNIYRKILVDSPNVYDIEGNSEELNYEQNDERLSELECKIGIYLNSNNFHLEDENINLSDLINFVENTILNSSDLYVPGYSGYSDSYPIIISLYSVFGNNLPENIFRNLSNTSKSIFMTNLSSISENRKKYLGEFINQKFSPLAGLGLLNLFKNDSDDDADISFDDEDLIDENPNEDKFYILENLIKTNEYLDYTPGEIYALSNMNFDKDELNNLIQIMSNAYRNAVKGTDEYYKLLILFSGVKKSNPKAFKDIFGVSSRLLYEFFDKSQFSEYGNEDYLNDCWKVYNIFGKRSKDWISKFKDLHDSLQILSPMSKEEAEGLGEYLLTCKLTLQQMKLIISFWPNLSDEERALPPKKLYTDLFMRNIKKISEKYDPQNNDFLIEFAQAYTDDEDEEKAFENTDVIYFRSGNSHEINYKSVENAFINSQNTPMPEWSNVYYEFNDNKKSYIGRFIPRSDPRGLLLGQYTNCCQHPFAEAKTSAFYGQTQPNSCFFVIENKNTKEILCQSWVWENESLSSKFNTVCFDNVESLGLGTRQDIVMNCYLEIAKQIAQKGYNVTTGTDGDLSTDSLMTSVNERAKKNLELSYDFLELPNETSDVYSDAREQYTLAKPTESI
jgi:hypothetical protein